MGFHSVIALISNSLSSIYCICVLFSRAIDQYIYYWFALIVCLFIYFVLSLSFLYFHSTSIKTRPERIPHNKRKIETEKEGKTKRFSAKTCITVREVL
jgi:hypothetical protein